MFTIGYFDGTTRKGLLAFTETDGEISAIGGMDTRGEPAYWPSTVITDDGGEAVLEGWVHPDEIIAHRNRFRFLESQAAK